MSLALYLARVRSNDLLGRITLELCLIRAVRLEPRELLTEEIERSWEKFDYHYRGLMLWPAAGRILGSDYRLILAKSARICNSKAQVCRPGARTSEGEFDLSIRASWKTLQKRSKLFRVSVGSPRQCSRPFELGTLSFTRPLQRGVRHHAAGPCDSTAARMLCDLETNRSSPAPLYPHFLAASR
jgi:hypothetical protein